MIQVGSDRDASATVSARKTHLQNRGGPATTSDLLQHLVLREAGTAAAASAEVVFARMFIAVGAERQESELFEDRRSRGVEETR